MYFSPTGSTKKVVNSIVEDIMKLKKIENRSSIDFTLPNERENELNFDENTLVVLGVPVYAGRVPNILLKFFQKIKGNNAIGIPIVLYGNRNYDDALIELYDIMRENGFKILGAGAFIGEHSFSKILASGRPDSMDFREIENFAEKLCSKLDGFSGEDKLKIKGFRPYRPYYRPQNPNGEHVDIRKVKPKTKDSCINCKVCYAVCPMGSIDYDSPSILNGICIKCGACIKKCPVEAKYYDDENYLRHKKELEIQFKDRRKVEIFL